MLSFSVGCRMADEFLSVSDIEKQEDVQFAIVDVPEWKDAAGKPGKIRLGSLTGEDMIEWTESNEGPAKRSAGLRLIIKSLVDSKGERTGSDRMLSVLQKRNTAVLNRLVREILKLNGMTKEQQEASKNGSSEASGGASLIDSPTNSSKVM